MIKNLIISSLIAAASFVPSIGFGNVGNPRKEVDFQEYGSFSATISYDGFGGANEFSGNFFENQLEQYAGYLESDAIAIGKYEDRDNVTFSCSYSSKNGGYYFSYVFSFYLDLRTYADDREKLNNFAPSLSSVYLTFSNEDFSGLVEDCEEDDEWYLSYEGSFDVGGNFDQGNTFTITFEEKEVENIPVYSSFVNCSQVSPAIPTEAIEGQEILLNLESESDDFGFPANYEGHFIVINNAIVKNRFYNYENNLGDGIFSRVSFTIIVGSAPVSLGVEALDVKAFRIGYDAGVASGSGWREGYEDGKSAGYQEGYQQGAEDYESGGVWSWFRSAALVMHSFLDIHIVGAFTLENLIGALVGLSIIVFFVRFFLFRG